jgi:hypothetical protein
MPLSRLLLLFASQLPCQMFFTPTTLLFAAPVGEEPVSGFLAVISQPATRTTVAVGLGDGMPSQLRRAAGGVCRGARAGERSLALGGRERCRAWSREDVVE